ncbi:hypothetical protein SBDP1_480027 [Syntrophobacter sp. SbD1]|nr:hypothetical protein SBDP1_480027 [Syntrophobacter sp. SbD1]
MNVISKEVADTFCKLCKWTYVAWITHKSLFDKNTNPEGTIGKIPYFTETLSKITQEYCLLQICKLHDPAKQRGSTNLTIDYMVRFGDWGSQAKGIKAIQKRLSALWDQLKRDCVRNKILTHNDLQTSVNNSPLGAFPEGFDDQYFQALQDFVNAVYDKWLGGPCPFDDLAESDVKEFLELLEGIRGTPNYANRVAPRRT